MKHIFIINPAAGKNKAACDMIPKIKSFGETKKLDFEIYETKGPGDATEYIKSLPESETITRFYACGGDGTVFEVVNGAYGRENTQIAVIPLGSGNDFIRLFGKKEDLLDLDIHLNGKPTELDLIKCGDIYAINQCSMGLDAEVNAKQSYFKKVPFMTGETAYVASGLYCFLKKVNNTFTIQIDDGEPYTQDTVFCVAANGRWYGGGFMAAPLAIPDDGLLDFIIVKKNMSRAKLLSLMGKYKAGKHLDWDCTTFVRGKKIKLHCDEVAAVNCDGEKKYVNDITFELAEKRITFVVPSNSSYFENKSSEKK